VRELPSGRIATVAGAVIAKPGGDDREAARVARLLATLFQEVVWVGAEPPADAPCRRADRVAGPAGDSRDLATALAAAAAERVLVICAGCARVTPDLLLALVAWPEADVVAPGVIADTAPPIALYRREPALRLLRAQLEDGRSGARAVFGALDSRVVDAEALRDVAVDADAG
jgi:molybdopterin-guanine dinucleotide biosynthesis protein A